MTLTLEISTEQERLITEGRVRKDANLLRGVLMQVLEDNLERWLERGSAEPRADSDFDVLAQRLWETFGSVGSSPAASLPDEALTREGIYQDHP